MILDSEPLLFGTFRGCRTLGICGVVLARDEEGVLGLLKRLSIYIFLPATPIVPSFAHYKRDTPFSNEYACLEFEI
jgi:hypothetical protein